jgi:integrase/recombinase XerD
MNRTARLSILFFPYKAKTNKEGKTPIYIRLTLDGKRKQFASGCFLPLIKWDPKKHRAKGASEESVQTNQSLRDLEQDINDSFLQLKRETEYLTIAKLVNKWKGDDINTTSLMDLLDYVIDKKINTKEESTVNKYETIKKRLVRFLDDKYNYSDILLRDIKRGFIADFEYYSQTCGTSDKKQLNQSTINKEIGRIKSMLNIAIENDWIDKNPFFGYKPEKSKIQKVYLTADELKRLEEKKFTLDRLQIIRDLFVFSCYTGLGYAEVAALGPNDITLDIQRYKWINLSRKKTKGRISLPLLPKAEKIIEKYANHPIAQIKGKLLPVYSNQKVNSYLKEIGDLCGITKTLTHHIARKTFTTTILLNAGIPMHIASKALAHTSVTTTEKYYGELRDEILAPHFDQIRQKQLLEQQSNEPIIKQANN